MDQCIYHTAGYLMKNGQARTPDTSGYNSKTPVSYNQMLGGKKVLNCTNCTNYITLQYLVTCCVIALNVFDL